MRDTSLNKKTTKPDITLIHASSPFLINEHVFAPLGILYLSAFLKEHGHKVQCLDMGMGSKPEEALSDTIGISFTTPQRRIAYQLCDYYKKLGKTVIAGGAHPTHMPEECLSKGFDKVFVGEAEDSLNYYLSGLINDCVKEYHSPERMTPIDSIPFPDRAALPIHDYRYEIDGVRAVNIMTSRGCPYRCSFCAKVSSKFRMQSDIRTLEEIYHLNYFWGYEAFMIFDDIFIANLQRLYEISNSLKDKKWKFRCFVRSNLVTEETCRLMKQMGVVEVGIGIESGSDKILEMNLKKTSRSINIEAIQLLKKYGIRVKTFLIVGLPGENWETIDETVSFLEETNPDDVDVSIFQPMPGSTVFKNPGRFDVSFTYDDTDMFYKGKPGSYETSVCTKELDSDDLIAFRDLIERIYKHKELLK